MSKGSVIYRDGLQLMLDMAKDVHALNKQNNSPDIEYPDSVTVLNPDWWARHTGGHVWEKTISGRISIHDTADGGVGATCLVCHTTFCASCLGGGFARSAPYMHPEVNTCPGYYVPIQPGGLRSAF